MPPLHGIGAAPAFSPQAFNPFGPGLPIGGRMTGAGSSGSVFSTAPGAFQLGVQPGLQQQQACHSAAQEADANMLHLAEQCRVPAQENGGSEAAGGLRLIDRAEEKALDAVFRHAAIPSVARELYAAGCYAARIGVADLAIALSELRANGGATENCDRLEQALCELMTEDRLGEHSGFAAWYEGNSYTRVQALTQQVMEALPDGVDIFDSVMQRETMPAIRLSLEARFGNLSYRTWEKIDAARGLISHAAAEAANRMSDSLRACERGDGSGMLHAKVNQWRVALHWVELMRPVERPDDAQPQPQPQPPPQPQPQPQPQPPFAAPDSPASSQFDSRQPGGPAAGGITQTQTAPQVHVTSTNINVPPDMASIFAQLLRGQDGANANARDAVAVAAPRSPARVARPLAVDGNDIVRLAGGAVANGAGDAHRRAARNASVAPATEPPEPRPAAAATMARTENPELRNNGSVPGGPSPSEEPRVIPRGTPPTPPTSPSSSTSSLSSAASELSAQNDGAEDSPIDTRSLSPVRDTVSLFSTMGVGARSPVDASDWPLSRSVSADAARSPAHASAAGASNEERVPLRSRPSSLQLRHAYQRVSSHTGSGEGASLYERLATATRTVQVGPGFYRPNGKSDS